MKIAFIVPLTILIACPGLCRGQVGGNVGYAQAGGKAKAEQSERSKRVLTKDELPPTGTSMFVEASVLMNVKADEYVAVFGISREGETVDECGRKMDATIKEFSDALKPLGVVGDDLFVDFVAQNKIYGFEVTGDIAREKLVGFEVKKNLSIHYRDRSLLDRFIAAAARAQVFDLIKVDYIVKDTRRVQERRPHASSRRRRRGTMSSWGSSYKARPRSTRRGPGPTTPRRCTIPTRRRSRRGSAATIIVRNTRSSPRARAGPSIITDWMPMASMT
jgi:uncharacterized protein YggE